MKKAILGAPGPHFERGFLTFGFHMGVISAPYAPKWRTGTTKKCVENTLKRNLQTCLKMSPKRKQIQSKSKPLFALFLCLGFV